METPFGDTDPTKATHKAQPAPVSAAAALAQRDQQETPLSADELRIRRQKQLLIVVWLLIKRIWYFPVVFAAIATLGMALLLWNNSKLASDRYTSEVRLLYAPPKDRTVWPEMQSRVVMELLQHREVYRRIADRMGLPSEAALRNRFSVVMSQTRDRKDVINIKLYAYDYNFLAEATVAYADAAVAEYFQYWSSRIHTWRMQQETNREGFSKELSSIENELAGMVAAPSYLPPGDELRRVQAVIATQLTDLDRMATEIADFEMRQHQTEIFLQAMNIGALRYMDELTSLENQAEAAHKNMLALEQRYTPLNPKYKMAKQLDIDLHEQLTKFKKEHGLENFDPGIASRIKDLSATNLTQSQQLQELRLRAEVTQKSLESNQLRVEKLLPLSQRYNTLLRQRELINTSLQKITTDEEAMAKMEMGLDASLTQLESSATISSNGGFGTRMIGAALGVGFLVGALVLFVCLVYKVIYGRVRTRRELSFFFGNIINLARVPDHTKYPAAAERARLQIMNTIESNFGFPSVLLICPTEGARSFTRGTYAAEWESLGRKVLVVDMVYVREGAITAKPTPGLATLSMQDAHHAVFQMVRQDFILPMHIFSLRRDLATLRKMYDLIVISRTDPIYGPELFLRQLRPYVKGLILITTYGRTHYRSLRRLSQWRTNWCPEIGAVLNYTPPPANNHATPHMPHLSPLRRHKPTEQDEFEDATLSKPSDVKIPNQPDKADASEQPAAPEPVVDKEPIDPDAPTDLNESDSIAARKALEDAMEEHREHGIEELEQIKERLVETQSEVQRMRQILRDKHRAAREARHE